MTDTVEIDEPQGRVHTVVIDCSSFTFIDSVGLHTLPSVSINVLLFNPFFYYGTLSTHH